MTGELSKITTITSICVILLRELRAERGIHQAQVADWIGKTPSRWSKVEAGNSPLQFETFVRVCNSFQIFPSAVMATAERYAALFIQKEWAVISSELESKDDVLMRQAQEYWVSPGGRNPLPRQWMFTSVLNGPIYNLDNTLSIAAVFQFALDPDFRAQQISPATVKTL